MSPFGIVHTISKAGIAPPKPTLPKTPTTAARSTAPKGVLKPLQPTATRR